MTIAHAELSDCSVSAIMSCSYGLQMTEEVLICP